MSDEVNPYAPPAAVEGEHRMLPVPLLALRGPSIGLLIFAGLGVLIGIVAALNLLAVFAILVYQSFADEHSRIVGRDLDLLPILVAFVSGVCSVIVIRGALNIRSGKNYRAARFAAIISCIPFLSPSIYFGIPFGIWALIVQRRKDVRAAFQSQCSIAKE